MYIIFISIILSETNMGNGLLYTNNSINHINNKTNVKIKLLIQKGNIIFLFYIMFIYFEMQSMFMVYLFLHDFHEHHEVQGVHNHHIGNLKLLYNMYLFIFQNNKLSQTCSSTSTITWITITVTIILTIPSILIVIIVSYIVIKLVKK